jgi:hypothetical protein
MDAPAADVPAADVSAADVPRADVPLPPPDATDVVSPDVLADVPSPDVIRVDAGVDPRCSAPAIDGIVGGDWPATAATTTNTVATSWGAGNVLRAMRVCYDATNLYLGIEGTVEAANGLVVYIDRDFGSASGIATLSSLTDNAGLLDDSVSAGLALTAPGFAAEAAWGTVGMRTVTATALDPGVGLRLFWPAGGAPDRRADFAWFAARSTCASGDAGMLGCEVAIPWASLFDGATRPVSVNLALFARINDPNGGHSSNQSLPEDVDLAMPTAEARTVRRVLAFSATP